MVSYYFDKGGYYPLCNYWNINLRKIYTFFLHSFAQNLGNYSTVNYWFDYWSDFKRDLDDDWPVLTAVDHFNDKGERTGHTVVALGYHIRKVDGKDVNFLQVADGWYRTTFRYLNFDYYKSVLIDGFCVKVYDLK